MDTSTLGEDEPQDVRALFTMTGSSPGPKGYEDLDELDRDASRTKYGNIHRLDRILRAEGDVPDRYTLAKQADTVMLFFLFTDRQLEPLVARLGYATPRHPGSASSSRSSPTSATCRAGRPRRAST